jgi:hypothetical protein
MISPRIRPSAIPSSPSALSVSMIFFRDDLAAIVAERDEA